MIRKNKIILAGGHDTQNLGDHGSLEVLQRDLRKRYPDCEIVLLSRHPDIGFDQLYHVRSIVNLDHKSKEESKGRIFNGLNPNDNTEHLQQILREFLTADLLVIGNGRLLIDITLDFMRGPLPYFALLVTLAKFTGVPIMIFSMTIVPVKTQIGNQLLKYIVSNADLITVREEPSKSELMKLGIPDDKINVIPDAAFGLDYIDRSAEGKEIIRKEGIPSDRKFIGVNLRFTHYGYEVNQDYFLNLARLCDSLFERLGHDILLISQMYYGLDNKYNDDREVYKTLYRNCKHQAHIHILEEKYDVFETLSIYQVCEMLFSMRRHGLIFASTQHVPVFGLTGEQNTSYCLKEIGIPGYQLPVEEINESTIKKISEAFQDREKIRASIRKAIPRLKKETAKYIGMIENLQ